ncbi:MAG: hypothetical protein EDM79_18700 [Chloroflexi bacterium]|nr:MAG: hypothetical protein EDM79_18700 [Chloroflexota bacterium]
MVESSGQTSPLFHAQASPNPMIIPPMTAKTKPTTAIREICSFSSKGESRATHNGPVPTKTTELATVVYSSDVIQVAK